MRVLIHLFTLVLLTSCSLEKEIDYQYFAGNWTGTMQSEFIKTGALSDKELSLFKSYEAEKDRRTFVSLNYQDNGICKVVIEGQYPEENACVHDKNINTVKLAIANKILSMDSGLVITSLSNTKMELERELVIKGYPHMKGVYKISLNKN